MPRACRARCATGSTCIVDVGGAGGGARARRGGAESSAVVRDRVVQSPRVQRERAGRHAGRDNALLRGPGLLRHCRARAQRPRRGWPRAVEMFRLSARGYHRVLRVARTIADLDRGRGGAMTHTSRRPCSSGARPRRPAFERTCRARALPGGFLAPQPGNYPPVAGLGHFQPTFVLCLSPCPELDMRPKDCGRLTSALCGHERTPQERSECCHDVTPSSSPTVRPGLNVGSDCRCARSWL